MFWQDHSKTYPLLILIVGLYGLKFFTLLVYKKKNQIKGRDNFIIGINSIYYIFLSTLGIILVMVLLRVNIKEFFTSISIIAAAIAIVSKDYIANAINGMILMFNNQLTIGDKVQIGHHKGKIVHVSLLNLQLLNEEDHLVFIPNSTVLSTDIINFTKGESNQSNMEFIVRSNAMNSLESLESYFSNSLEVNPNIVKDSFRLKIIELKYDRLKLRAEANLIKRDNLSERAFKRQLVNAWFSYLQKLQPIN